MKWGLAVALIFVSTLATAKADDTADSTSTQAGSTQVEECQGGCFNAVYADPLTRNRAADAETVRRLLSDTKGNPPPIGASSTVDEH